MKKILRINDENAYIVIAIAIFGLIPNLLFSYLKLGNTALILGFGFIGFLVAGSIFLGLKAYVCGCASKDIEKITKDEITTIFGDCIEEGVKSALKKKNEYLYLLDLKGLLSAEEQCKINECKIIEVTIIESDIEYDTDYKFLTIEASNINKGVKYFHYTIDSPKNEDYLIALKEKCSENDVYYAYLEQDEINDIIYSKDTGIVLYNIEGKHQVNEIIGYMTCPGLFDGNAIDSQYHIRLSQIMVNEIRKKLKTHENKLQKFQRRGNIS